MKFFKRNSGIQELVRANDKAEKNRDRILVVAVTLALIVLFSAFNIVKGKIKVDSLKNIRENGTSANAYMENGTEEQYEQIEQLDYINKVGKENDFGFWYQGDTPLAICAVLDNTGYEDLVKPAYGEIVGEYPDAENEIMISRRILKKIGITNPQIGMKISTAISWNDWTIHDGKEQAEAYILSGYYTDYIKESENMSTAYFSEKYFKSNKAVEYPTKLLIKLESDWLSWEQIEETLYQDIEVSDENQQFVGLDSAGYQAVEKLVGGYGIAILLGFIILLSAYLLIYNILSISMSKDIRQYGLLKTIGTTHKQIRKIMFEKSIKVIIHGCLFGGVICIITSWLVLPILFRKFYLQGAGDIGIGDTFHFITFLCSMLFVVVVTLVANGRAGRKLKNLSPIEAYRHTGVSVNYHKKTSSKKGASLWKMAWRNTFLSKRKFFITIISLFIGCEIALCTIVITKGTDKMNELLQNPDFQIGTEYNTVGEFLVDYIFGADNDKSLFDKTLVDRIAKVDGVDKNSMGMIFGCYGTTSTAEKSMQPRNYATSGTNNVDFGATIQVVDNDYIKKLETYVKENHLNIDMNSLKAGTGIILLHKHELSQFIETEAEKVVGEPLHIYQECLDTEGVEYSCSGYLDTTKKGFPRLSMTWNGDGINYFIVSKKGFEKLPYTKQIFHITFDVKDEEESRVKKELEILIKEKNNELGKDTYYLTSNSDAIMSETNYIGASRIVMGALSAVLILMGMVNYLNTVITNMVSRGKEFAVMESVGMTKKQLKKMLAIEGFYYYTCIVACLLSIGSLVFWLLEITIKKSISYFRFIYPVVPFLTITMIMLMLCVFVPRVVYNRSAKKSAMERLRDH